MKSLVCEYSSGRRIANTISAPATTRTHQDGRRAAISSRTARSWVASSLHPASRVSSPSSPWGRRIMIMIR